MTSIIIPAHNEAAVIGPCIDAVLNDPSARDVVEVIVVCNGCSDETADLARLRDVVVLEVSEASKAAALSAGDAAASSFPRLYLDADVVLSRGSVGAIERALNDGFYAAAPQLRLDVSNASIWVKMYQRVWSELPEIKTGLLGRGAYALSEQAWGEFPGFRNVVADDLYVHRSFWPDRGGSVEGASTTVQSSLTVADLLTRKRRVFRGNRELVGESPAAQDGSRWADLGLIVREQPVVAASVPVYLALGFIARALARRDAQLGTSSWGRDASSR